MNKNERSVRSMVENLPLDQALECIVSELGTYMTKIQTALELLDKAHPELDIKGREIVQIAQVATSEITRLINDTMRDVLVPRLQSK